MCKKDENILQIIDSVRNRFKILLDNPKLEISFFDYIYSFDIILVEIKYLISYSQPINITVIEKFNNKMTGVFRTFEGQPLEDLLYNLSDELRKRYKEA